jgi:branched-chain amino acid transport system ATP-binding protein
MSGNLFEVTALCKRFGGLQAIENVDMGVPEGEIRALIGPNGAGKTTFLNLITGVYAPTSGAIRLDGRSLAGLRPSSITATGIARTFQHPALFEGMSIRDNVIVAAYTHERRTLIRDLLGGARSRRAAAQARELAMRWLDFVGLGAKADERVGVLTPAGRRLLEMARAMATKPRLLLLDEPFGGMTHEESDSLSKKVLELRGQGVTILLIDHNMRMVMKLADRITVLSFGRKIAEGTPSEMQSSTAVIAAYLGQPSGPAAIQ